MNKTWLISRPVDLCCLFLPVWVCWVICFFIPEDLLSNSIPLWIWVIFILSFDVSHVWSTLFRTYFDKEELHNHRSLLLWTPFICLTLGFSIASYSTDLFWRILAYLAVFHFIKQQFGFLSLYKTRFKFNPKKYFSDKWVIYLSMLYPIIFWHLTEDRNFEWFSENDFILPSELGIPIHNISNILSVFNWLYWLIITAWLIEETYIHLINKCTLPIGKILWLLSTAINWYLGIVYFNSDLVFSITNVVAHGIPYIVLVIFYINKKDALANPTKKKQEGISFVPKIAGIVFAIWLFAFGEEYFWDMLIYREKSAFFEHLMSYPLNALSNPHLQALGIAILTIPQTTHYVLDGFIWKNDTKNPYMKKIFKS